MASAPKLAAQDDSSSHKADIVVVGAGIIGCALAVAFGKQGRSVIVLDRSLQEPDRIVGELLQPGGVRALEKLGIADCLEGIDAIPVHGYQVIYQFDPVHIPYPTDPEFLDNGREPEGRSFHHGRFVQKLRAAAARTPNVRLIQSTVKELVKNEWTGQILGVECKTNDQKDYYFGSLTFVADGSASNFRKVQNDRPPVARSKFFGLELIDTRLPMPQHGHVLLGNFSPILLYQIGTHETRILIDIPDTTIASLRSRGETAAVYMRDVVLPVLPDSVKPAFETALEAGKPRAVPNQWLPPRMSKVPGVIVLGDAMNMRHPLTGGGMTVAFNDAVLISDLLSPENVPNLANTKLVLEQMRKFHWQRKDVTSTINILAQALYSLFAANDKNLRALQKGCFRYFQRGGTCVSGPCGLLAGIIRNPLVLIYHFFSVALLAIWVDAASYPIPLIPFMLIIRGAILLWTACVVILPYIGAELTS